MSVGWPRLRADELGAHHLGRSVRIPRAVGGEVLGVLVGLSVYPMAAGMPRMIVAYVAPDGHPSARSISHVLSPATVLEFW